MYVQDLSETDLGPVSRLWWLSWHAAHADMLPAMVVNERSLDSFRERARFLVGRGRVAMSDQVPMGFCAVLKDEIQLLYVAPDCWRRGVGRILLEDAQRQLVERTYRTAWLTCYQGNTGADRFYASNRWRKTGTFFDNARVRGRQRVSVAAWRYEKQLRAG